MEEKGLFKKGKEDIDREMYHYAINTLKSNGYHHYEISNFAKKGLESIHNLSIWN